MPKVVKSFLGGDDGSAKAAERTSAAAIASNERINAENREFLRQSQLISGGGILTNRLDNGGLGVSVGSDRLRAVNKLSRQLGRRGRDFRRLGRLVRPGFSEFRETGLNNLRDQRRRVVGNLRDNLARRRLAGSSFASDAVSRAEAEFQKREDEFTAQTFLQEIDARQQLLTRETELLAQSTQTLIDELNLEAETALQLSGIANSGISQLAAAQTAANSSISSNLSALQQRSGENATSIQTSLLSFGLGRLLPV